MNDFKTGSGQDVSRGRGPWPKDNSLSSVTAWLINRLGATDEQDRELMSVSRLMLDSVSGMERGERLSRRWQAGESQLEALSILADRWNSGQPLQHMLNEAHFMGLKLLSDGRALIPRPETEELVHAMMDLSSSLGSNTRRVLDVGTGSGCIALAWSKRHPLDAVVGLDVSREALDQAALNAELVGAHDVIWEHRNALENQDAWPAQSFDVVISNPPYIPASERTEMELRVVDEEPSEALFVPDADPLLFYKSIVESSISAGWLKQGGWLGFECHKDFTEDVLGLLSAKEWERVERRKDMQGEWRFVFARLR